MGIEKRNRVYTEQSTSINQDIMKSQKGIISFVPGATTGLIIGIPTTIEDPRMLTLLPMSAVTAGALNANAAGSGSPWYCDLTLHHASAVSRAFASVASTVLASEIGKRIRISVTDLSLYIAQASLAVGGASNTVVIASESAWKLDPRFASNAKKYLRVYVNLYASALLHSKKQVLAYEVQGY
jgi:hypothetical protein